MKHTLNYDSEHDGMIAHIDSLADQVEELVDCLKELLITHKVLRAGIDGLGLPTTTRAIEGRTKALSFEARAEALIARTKSQ